MKNQKQKRLECETNCETQKVKRESDIDATKGMQD